MISALAPSSSSSTTIIGIGNKTMPGLLLAIIAAIITIIATAMALASTCR